MASRSSFSFSSVPYWCISRSSPLRSTDRVDLVKRGFADLFEILNSVTECFPLSFSAKRVGEESIWLAASIP